MPGLDGGATLAALRADAVTATIPVIFLTALDAGPELDRLVGLGAAGAIRKPFEPWTLPAELLRLLGR
jgi:CheY-like chemotaxis protein